MIRRSRLVAVALLGALALSGTPWAAPSTRAEGGGTASSPGGPGVVPPHTNDFCQEQCYDVLTPGEDGFATFSALTAAQAGISTTGGHIDDQFDQYQDLVFEQNLTNDKLKDYFNSSTFGVAA